jgi:hypothetical protein
MTTTKNPPKATAEVRPDPPAAAVAADAHWAAKMAKLRERKTPTYTLRICDDDNVKARLRRAERALALAEDAASLSPDDQQAAAALEAAKAAEAAAREAVEAATLVKLTFRGLPRPQYRNLIKEHPPTEEQAEEGGAWNEDTFPAALISAASVDGMSEDEALELLTTWAQAEAVALFRAAQTPQEDDRTDLGKG